MEPRARLEWRCRRGTRELDLLLQNWLRREFEHSLERERQSFIELLEWRDDDLLRLLLGLEEADSPKLNDLAGKIRALSLSRP